MIAQFKSETGALGLAVFDTQGKLMAGNGPSDVLGALAHQVVNRSLQKGARESAFGHAGDWQWLEESFPLHNGNLLAGAMVDRG